MHFFLVLLYNYKLFAEKNIDGQWELKFTKKGGKGTKEKRDIMKKMYEVV